MLLVRKPRSNTHKVGGLCSVQCCAELYLTSATESRPEEDVHEQRANALSWFDVERLNLLKVAVELQAAALWPSFFRLTDALLFDHTGGFVTGVALTNPGASDLTITLSFRTSNGTQLLQDKITLAGLTHTAFLFTDKYPLTKNQRGVAERTGG